MKKPSVWNFGGLTFDEALNDIESGKMSAAEFIQKYYTGTNPAAMQTYVYTKLRHRRNGTSRSNCSLWNSGSLSIGQLLVAAHTTNMTKQEFIRRYKADSASNSAIATSYSLMCKRMKITLPEEKKVGRSRQRIPMLAGANEQNRIIVETYLSSKLSQAQLAERFGMTKQNICIIINKYSIPYR